MDETGIPAVITCDGCRFLLQSVPSQLREYGPQCVHPILRQRELVFGGVVHVDPDPLRNTAAFQRSHSGKCQEDAILREPAQ